MPYPTRRTTTAAVVAGVLLAVTAGCTAAPDPAASTTPSGSTASGAGTESAAGSTADPVSREVVIDITLTGGTVRPNGTKIDVARGQTVTLNVTSDHDDEVHVHGFDIEIPVTAGTLVSKGFVADQAGSVEIESHHPSKIIAILNVR